MEINSNAPPVKVGFRFKPHHQAAAEWFWARPVKANGGGDTYVLTNYGFDIPVMVGDIVRAELDGASMLQVTGIEQLQEGTVSCVCLPPEASGEEVLAVANGWLCCGALHSECNGEVLVTGWPDMGPQHVAQVILTTVPPGWMSLDLHSSPHRLGCIEELVDFRLERTLAWPSEPVPCGCFACEGNEAVPES